MSRYKIWDKVESIVTPSGQEFTAAEWCNKHKWVNKPGAKMIIGAGVINGTVAMEFDTTIEYYKKNGCPIDETTMTDEEILLAIENFEDNPPVIEPEPDTTERMIALEEYKSMIELAGYCTPKNIISKNFKRGLWTESMLDKAIEMGCITEADKIEIMSM